MLFRDVMYLVIWGLAYSEADKQKRAATTYKLVGLFPVSSADKKGDDVTNLDEICIDFMSDGWYMLVAMDFAVQKINSVVDYDFQLEAVKLDTCSAVDENYWVPNYHNTLLNDGITGIVGASYSSNSKLAAHLSTVLEIPMITYQSSATSISDTVYFPYFYRTIPIDDLQVMALKQLLCQMNLTYIALFYDTSPYGEGLKQMIMTADAASGETICLLDGGYEINSKGDYSKEKERIISSDAIKAIGVFGYREDMYAVRDAMGEHADNYIWIASDGWAQFDVPPQIGRVVGTTFSASVLSGFKDFYNQKMLDLAAESSTYNDRDQTYNLYTKFRDKDSFISEIDSVIEDKTNYITPVVEAVFAFAEALNDTTSTSMQDKLSNLSYNLTKVFDIKSGTCCVAGGLEKLTYGTRSYGAYAYSAYSYNSTIQITSEEDRGNGSYSHGDQNKTWIIGSWNNEADKTFDIYQDELDSLVSSWNMTQTASQCTQCLAGHIRDQNSRECCKACTVCDLTSQYTDASHMECKNCTEDKRPLNDSSGCELVIPAHTKYTDPVELTILISSCIGIMCVVMTYWYMYMYTYTPIARASGREYMLLVAICTCMCFISPFVLFAIPSKFVCMVQRVIVAGPIVGIIAACLVRTFSIDRIFRHPGVRQRLLSKRLVLLIIGFLIVIELFIETIIMVAMPSVPQTTTFIAHKKRTLECTMPSEDIMLTFIFPGMLVLLCGIFALRIRNVPSNYNESRYIIFTITILIFESITFFMIFKKLDYMQYIRYSVACIVIGTYMTYIALFVPRLFIILFKPERNTLQLQCAAAPQFLGIKGVDKGCNTSFSMEDSHGIIMRTNGGISHCDSGHNNSAV